MLTIYRSLLDTILYYHGDDNIAGHFNNKIRPFLSNEDKKIYRTKYRNKFTHLRQDKVLIIDSNEVNTCVNIFLIKKEISRSLSVFKSWSNVIENNDLNDYFEKSKINDIGTCLDIDIECINCCKYRDLMQFKDDIYLCKECISDIKKIGTFETKSKLKFLSSSNDGPINGWYTIGNLSLNLFYIIDNNCFRYILTRADKLTTLPLKSVLYLDIGSMCEICSIRPVVFANDIPKVVQCAQCYNIMTCRNNILIKFIISKLLIFTNYDEIDRDVVMYIANILIQLTIVPYI